MSQVLVRTAAATIAAAAAIVTFPAAASADQIRPAVPTAAVQTGDVAPMSVHRKHRKCNKPKGKRFNISWSPGMSSTTFYFNNHCKGTNYIKVFYTDSVPHLGKCRTIKVKPGVKGHKKLWGVIKGNIDYVGFGKCP